MVRPSFASALCERIRAYLYVRRERASKRSETSAGLEVRTKGSVQVTRTLIHGTRPQSEGCQLGLSCLCEVSWV